MPTKQRPISRTSTNYQMHAKVAADLFQAELKEQKFISM